LSCRGYSVSSPRLQFRRAHGGDRPVGGWARKLTDAPLQGFPYASTHRSSSPSCDGSASRSTLTGFTRLSELLSGRRSGSLVHRSLLAVFTTSRSSVVRPVRTQASERLPQAWPPSQGTSLTADRRPVPVNLLPGRLCHPVARMTVTDSGSPRGVWRPFSDVRNRVRSTRACLTRHVPSSEFLTPSTVCSPATLRSRGPLPLVGFLFRSDLRVWFAGCCQPANTSRSLRPGPKL
jgi:hypothetical protein